MCAYALMCRCVTVAQIIKKSKHASVLPCISCKNFSVDCYPFQDPLFWQISSMFIMQSSIVEPCTYLLLRSSHSRSWTSLDLNMHTWILTHTTHPKPQHSIHIICSFFCWLTFLCFSGADDERINHFFWLSYDFLVLRTNESITFGVTELRMREGSGRVSRREYHLVRVS